MKGQYTYIAIDMKSFYASVECVARGYDPLRARLLVVDVSRSDQTICLAVSPALKDMGVPSRPRLFEAKQAIQRYERLHHCTVSYVAAVPRMALYEEVAAQIHSVLLGYAAAEDIHVYSIDECFIDVTPYLHFYREEAERMRQHPAHVMAMKMVREILKVTGITATVGIGTNLYLAKIAMDIVAKHVNPDEDGVRIASLDEMRYRQLLWNHTPITDFWRVGPGYAKKLKQYGMYTMGDIARCSVGSDNSYHNEDLLYRLFGINAELLIDHAWGWEPCTIADVKGYRPETKSICSGQVLHCPYEADKARIIMMEMADALSLDLVSKGLVTDQLVVTIGYDSKSLETPGCDYTGKVKVNHYGKRVPEHAHGTTNLKRKTSSTKLIIQAAIELYDRIVDKNLLIRRLNLSANHLVDEKEAQEETTYEQYNLFTDYDRLEKQKKEENAALEKERKLQQAMLDIKSRFGKNAVLKGTNFLEGATARERNEEIGGHKA